MKDTLRLILFLECNLDCPYCCNKYLRDKFQEKTFAEIEFARYSNVCITGGEPFLNKPLLYSVLERIPADKNLFIYTNGLLVDEEDIKQLCGFKNLKCVNISLHYFGQLLGIPDIEQYLPVRFAVQDVKKARMLKLYPQRLTDENTKAWRLDDCERPNEDWILLRTGRDLD